MKLKLRKITVVLACLSTLGCETLLSDSEETQDQEISSQEELPSENENLDLDSLDYPDEDPKEIPCLDPEENPDVDPENPYENPKDTSEKNAPYTYPTSDYSLTSEESMDMDYYYMTAASEENTLYAFDLIGYSPDSGYSIGIHYPTLRLNYAYDEIGFEPYGAYIHYFHIKELPLFWEKNKVYYFKDIDSRYIPLEEQGPNSPYKDFSYQGLNQEVQRVSFDEASSTAELRCPQMNTQERTQVGVYEGEKFIPLCEYNPNQYNPTTFEYEEDFRYLPTGLKVLEENEWVEEPEYSIYIE